MILGLQASPIIIAILELLNFDRKSGKEIQNELKMIQPYPREKLLTQNDISMYHLPNPTKRSVT